MILIFPDETKSIKQTLAVPKRFELSWLTCVTGRRPHLADPRTICGSRRTRTSELVEKWFTVIRNCHYAILPILCTSERSRSVYFTWLTAKFPTKEPTKVFVPQVGFEPTYCQSPLREFVKQVCFTDRSRYYGFYYLFLLCTRYGIRTREQISPHCLERAATWTASRTEH